MKQIYIMALLLLTGIGAYAQSGREVYNKWSDSEGVSAIYISSSMFKMIGKLPEIKVEIEDGQSMDLAPIINSLEGFYMLDIENAAVGGQVIADVKQMIGKGKYELMMEMKDSGETVRIYTKGGKVVESLVFFCQSPGDIQLICIDGAINRSDLETLIATASN